MESGKKNNSNITGDNNITFQGISDSQINIVYDNKKIPKHLTAPPFLPKPFIGRELDIETIRRKLFQKNNLLLLVNGEGGIGKTSIGAYYYHKFQDEYKHLAWVLCETNIINALLRLANPLGIKFENTIPQNERIQILLARMASLKKPCLLIIDNVDDLQDLNAQYQTLNRCSNFHIILTTRITKFEKTENHIIKGLTKKQSIELFKSHYTSHNEREDGLFF